MAHAIILMGVSGSGKSSIGEALSTASGLPFFDGDDFMPAKQIKKMERGIPLNDLDRQPWLEALHQLIANHLQQGQSLIVASSALKQKYREVIRGDLAGVDFVYLKGSFELIFGRINQRKGHFMKAGMLHSQFDTLQVPKDALTIDIEKGIPDIVQQIIDKFSLY
jgi:gluconokinase